MKEIKIYLDKQKTKEVNNNIEFEKLTAGEKSSKKLYVYNTTNYYLNTEFTTQGDATLIKRIEQIGPGKTEEIELEFYPEITKMSPVNAILSIKLNYTVR